MRERILILLQQRSPATVQLLDISKTLGIRSETPEYAEMKKILHELTTTGIIYKSARRKYGMVKHEETPTTFTGLLNVRNFKGTVKTGSPSLPLIYIDRPYLQCAMHGDLVTVAMQSLDRQGRPHGEVTEVVQRNPNPIACKLEYDGHFYFAIPDDEHIHVDFLIHPSNLLGATDGDKVSVKVERWNDPFKSPEGKILEVIGKAGRTVVEHDSIAREYGLHKLFPAEVDEEANKAKVVVSAKELARRTDFRNHAVLTIDPVDAKDFDDALSIEKTDKGTWIVGVHIADVGHYVREDTALDQEAFRRGTSTYLVDGVVPMLPEHLSNDICSLVPGKTRFTFSVVMEFSDRGALKSYQVVKSIIKSKRRFSYEEVQEILEGKKTDPFEEDLNRLNALAKTLRKKRFLTGGIDFDTREVKFILDENKHPVSSYVKRRSDATMLVEEFMLAANRTVATHIELLKKKWRLKNEIPFLYRVHDEPDYDKLREALKLVQTVGGTVPQGKLTSKDINDVLEKTKGSRLEQAISQLVLRSQSKAVYSDLNTGHYGLGFTHYSHFTSPIRRYPDLVIHRLLEEYAEDKPEAGRWKKLDNFVAEAAVHCSDRERVATEAERASIKLTQVTLCRNRVGEEFEGSVSGITGFGIFILMDDLNAEGLLKLRDLDDDYYYLDEKTFSLVGRRKRRVFQFGTRVKVRIARVNVEKREIDLVLAKPAQAETPTESLPEVAPDRVAEALDIVESISRKDKRRKRRKDKRKNRGGNGDAKHTQQQNHANRNNRHEQRGTQHPRPEVPKATTLPPMPEPASFNAGDADALPRHTDAQQGHGNRRQRSQRRRDRQRQAELHAIPASEPTPVVASPTAEKVAEKVADKLTEKDRTRRQGRQQTTPQTQPAKKEATREAKVEPVKAAGKADASAAPAVADAPAAAQQKSTASRGRKKAAEPAATAQPAPPEPKSTKKTKTKAAEPATTAQPAPAEPKSTKKAKTTGNESTAAKPKTAKSKAKEAPAEKTPAPAPDSTAEKGRKRTAKPKEAPTEEKVATAAKQKASSGTKKRTATAKKTK